MNRIIACPIIVLLASSVAHAMPITFETTPTGAGPADNQVLDHGALGFYQDGTTFVQFGFDTNSDLTIDTPARFEQRSNNGEPAGTVAYVLNNPPNLADRDVTPTNEGGDWMLRDNNEAGATVRFGDAFLIAYTGSLPTSASGQVWDIDFTEAFRVTAFDASNAPVGVPIILGPFGVPGQDGRPTTFSFSNLTSPIQTIQIVRESPTAGGFAFDNFNATQPASAVPEPATITLLAAAGIGMLGCAPRRRGRPTRGETAGKTGAAFL